MNFINGVAGETISVRDRGLAYGDGVFRTLRVRAGKPVLWQRQYAKLLHDCRALALDCPAQDTLERDFALLPPMDCVAKIIVSRGDGVRGYAPPAQATPARALLSGPLPTYPDSFATEGVTVRVCNLKLAVQPRLAGIKHLNRLENVLARAEWTAPEIGEGLVCDADGRLIGGTMSNLFIVKNDRLFTPELRRCGVSGVTRELVIELARERGIEVIVGATNLDQLLDADAAFVVNSVIGLWPVARLERKTWQRTELVKALQEWVAYAQGA